MYKISIIIPVFNTEKELVGTLDSIINQTMNFEEIEVIMINDGSTDKSGHIMELYSKEFNNFKSIHLQENTGSPGEPRNIGIKHATAKYIMFQDSDDLYDSHACELLYKTIEEEKVDIVGGMLTVKNNKNEDVLPIKKWISILKETNSEKLDEESIKELLTQETLFKLKLNSIEDNLEMLNDSGFTTKIFKKSFLEKNNIKFPKDLRGGEDAVFLFKCMITAHGIIFINKIISHYDTKRNKNVKSLSHDKSFETVNNRITSYKLMYNISLEKKMKKIFIENMLHVKLKYWFETHLLNSNLTASELIKLFKEGQILFEECLNYKVPTSNYLLEIYDNIKNDKFAEAILKINKRSHNPKLLISIIIPVFNVENTIPQAFDSILNQSLSFENLEIIFIDDCSTDNSLNMIKNLAKQYKNVKYYSTNENSGYAGKPRNIGIENATTEYLMFLDPDDLYLENACEILYTNIINNELDMVSANYDIYRDSTTTRNNWNYIGLKNNETRKVKSIDEYPKFLMPPASVWTKIFKRDLIIDENIKFLVGVPAQDLVFVSQSLLNANGIKFINKPVAKYMPREKGDSKSITSTRDKKTLIGYLKSYSELYYSIYHHNPEYTWLATRNLHFWLKQFVLSSLEINDKVDLLYCAKPLLQDFIDSKKINPSKGLEKFFELIEKQDFTNAARLSYKLHHIYDNSEPLEEIKKRHIFLIINSNLDKQYLNHISNFRNNLKKHNYPFTLLNLDNIQDYTYMINTYDNNALNIFNYYSKKNTINTNYALSKNKLKFDEIDKKSVERIVKKDKSIILNYFDEQKNLVKSEIYIDYYLNLIKYYEKGTIKSEEYYTIDGYNYLSFQHDSHKLNITLHDRLLNFDIKFEDINEFKIYFLIEIFTKQKKQPFLIDLDSDRLTSDSNFNYKLVCKINEKFIFDKFEVFEQYLIEGHLNENKETINSKLIELNELNQKYTILKEQNQKLYIENQILKDNINYLKDNNVYLKTHPNTIDQESSNETHSKLFRKILKKMHL